MKPKDRNEIEIRRAKAADWEGIWRILEPVFRTGETYVYDPEISEQEAREIWLEFPESTWVAVDAGGQVLGTYYLKPNQPGLGNHVVNAGYVVGEASRGKGLAAQMCRHSQEEARVQGYLAMQFNLVISTNDIAVSLWQKLGFRVVGVLPGAYRHVRLGRVDAFVMWKELEEPREEP